jgi:uncharacterized delta-60 repeat protein
LFRLLEKFERQLPPSHRETAMHRTSLLLGTALLLCSLAPALAQVGFYDPTFSPPEGRRLLYELPQTNNARPPLLIDAQSRMLFGGSCLSSGTTFEECVIRLTPIGAVDNTFGPALNGRYEGPEGDTADLMLLGDGRILGASRVADSIELGALFVLTSNGSGLDQTTLGGVGRVALGNYPRRLRHDLQGRVLVGMNTPSALPTDFVLRRYHLGSGLQDAGFGGGERRIGFDLGGENSDALMDVLLLPDQRILVAGVVSSETDQRLGMAQLLPDGDPDPSFGTGGGRRIYDHANQFSSFRMARDAAGRIVVVGTHRFGNLGFSLRILADGTPDTGFEACATAPGASHWSFNYGNEASTASAGLSALPQADGKTLLLGQATFPSGTYFVVMRLNPDGCLDPSFGIGGRGVGNFMPGDTFARAGAMAVGNGGLMVTGIGPDFATRGIARILLDTVFRDGFEGGPLEARL